MGDEGRCRRSRCTRRTSGGISRAHFSPNTHLTGEALGLFYAGVLFREFADAPRWRELGARILLTESRRQITADGVHFEQSTCYQRYTIDIYLHFLLLAARNGISVPPALSDKRHGAWWSSCCRCASQMDRIPLIGDVDGGALLPLTRRGPDDARGIFAVAAATFDRSDFAWAAQGLAPEVPWLLGRAGEHAFEALRPACAARSGVARVSRGRLRRSCAAAGIAMRTR